MADSVLSIQQAGPWLRVSQRVPTGPALHVARFLPLQPRTPTGGEPGGGQAHRRGFVLPRPPHPDVLEELRLLLIEQPTTRYDPGHEYLARSTEDSLSIPWGTDELSGLTAPADALWERTWGEQWRIAVLATPGVVGVPGTADDMANAAWRVLLRVERTLLVRILAVLAVRLEVWGHASPYARELVGDLGLPPGLHPRLVGEVRSGSPLFDPRCLRWAVQEIAAASAEARWSHDMAPPAPANPGEVALIEQLLFSGTLLGGTEPTLAELLRAIWLLHEGYSAENPNGLSGLDAVLSLTGSLGFGHRPRLGWWDRLSQWRRVWEVPDDHPAIEDNPAARGQAHRPSDLRGVFSEHTGLTIGDWLVGGLAVVARFFTWIASNEPHLALPERLAETVSDRGELSRTFVHAMQNGMTTTLEEFGRALKEEMGEAGRPYAGLGTTPTYDTRALRTTPIVVLGDDGAWAPLGLALLTDRIVEFPRSVVLNDGRLGDARVVGTLMGYMFEAVINDMMTSLRRRHHVLTEAQVAEAVGCHVGGDGVIGYDHRYLVVEASIQTLGPHVAEGAPRAVRRRCTDYHSKADQGEETAAQLHRIARHHSRPAPEASVTLVVTDIPLTLNPAVGAELRSQRPDRNPKFVCSLEEFEWLLALGDAGWEIPAAVMNWQARSLDVPLADQLERLSDYIGPGAHTGWRFDLQAWLDEIPIEASEAA